MPIFWYQKMIFWYQKLFSDIKKSEFLISENNFWYQTFDIKNYQKFDFLISENRTYFLISENDFLISENDFLISEIHFWYQKFISDIRNSCWFSDIRNWFSDIRKSFSDIRKSALKSYLAFHSGGSCRYTRYLRGIGELVTQYFIMQAGELIKAEWRKTYASVSLCLSHIQPRAPYDFYHPYDFLPVRPSEAPVGILRWCCSHGHIRLRPRTVRHGCILMVWLNNSQDSTGTPYDARTGIARESSMFFISYGARAGYARVPHGALADT